MAHNVSIFLLVLLFITNYAFGLCYHEDCHCPEAKNQDLQTPGSELLIKLQDLRRNLSLNNLTATYSQGSMIRIFFTKKKKITDLIKQLL